MCVIRHKDCELLIKNGLRCDPCSIYRTTLNGMMCRKRKSSVEYEIPIQTNDRYLNKEQLLQKLRTLEREKKKLTAQRIRLQEKIKTQIKTEGSVLHDDDGLLMNEVMEKHQHMSI